MIKFCSQILRGLFLTVLLVASALAQATNGRLEGSVKDASGALVPNATVTIVNQRTNQERTVTTNEEGFFAVAELAPGDYNVKIEAPNFRVTNVSDVIVAVGTPATVNIELAAGSISETVEVSGEDAQEAVNTTNAEIGDVVDRRRVLDLPLDGRNPLDLIALQAGASETGRVNGNRARAINVTVNGVNASDNFNKSEDNIVNNPTVPVSVESVREFRVTTGLATAEFGRGSAQVNVISQSGSNNYSGSLFVFHRNTAFNANNFFNNRTGVEREFLIRNQYGGRIGGPVRIPKFYNGTDKTFFFFSYEGTRLAASETVNRLVYTAEARAGNFRYLNGLPVTPINVANNPGAIRSVNVLSLSNRAADPSMTTYLARTQLPNNFDRGDGLNTGGFRFNARRSAPKDIYSFRADHRFSDKYALEFNYSYGDDFQFGDVVNGRLQFFPGGFGTDRLLRSRSVSTALQMNLSPQTVNEFRFGLVNPHTNFTNQAYTGDYTLFLNTVDDPVRLNAPNGRQIPVTQFIDNFTHVRGSHLLKAGFDIRLLRGKVYSYAGVIPEIDFNTTDNDPGFVNANFPGISTATANLATITIAERLINNLTGAIGSITQSFNATSATSGFVPGEPLRRNYATSEFDFYVQDTWKARSNLTLNFGLRYEYSTVPRDRDNLVNLPVGGTQGLFGPTAAENLFTPGGATNPRSRTELVPEGSTFFEPDRNNFAPVISFAYSPFKDNKTSLRAGYRISYIRENFNLFENIVRTNPGLSVTKNFIVGDRFLRNGAPPVPPPTFVLPLSLQQQFQENALVDIAGFDENLKTPLVQEWTASIEREIFKDVVLEARYVGNKSDNLIRVYDINEVNIFAVNPTSGQSFLQAFNIARANLANNLAITVNNPLFARIFSGAGASQATSTVITNPIRAGEAGELADIISRRRVNNINGGLLFNSGLPINFFRPNPDVNAAFYAENGSRSTFHALQLEIRRRFRQGFSFQINYQFGKDLSDFTGTTTNQSSFVTLRDPDYDYRAQSPYHQVKANFIYELPFGNKRRFLNRGGFVNALVGGFQLGGIVRWESGTPITITSGRGTINRISRSGLNTVDIVGGQSLANLRGQLGAQTIGNTLYYFDPTTFRANFADPQPGTLGSLQRDAFEGPRYFRADLSVIKRTAITERQNIELRAEFFNVFNTVNFSNPNTSFLSTNFGVISTTRGNPRILQFAVRYNF